MTRVSVIIPNWNGAKLLPLVLESLAESTFQNFEIVVVDNGSEDASCALIRERYPHVRLIELDRNYGFARAVNTGIKNNPCELIVLLNNDIEVAPNWLMELVTGMDQHPEISMGTSRMMYWQERDVFCNTGDGFTLWGGGLARGEGQSDRGQYDSEEEVFGVCAGAAIYRRELFDHIGLFDETFESLVEDVDLNARARLAGHRALYFPKACVYHIGSATLGRYSDRYIYFANRNEWWSLFKNMPLALFFRYGLSIWRHHWQTTLYFAFRGQGSLLFRARWDALLGLPHHLKQRTKIQRESSLSRFQFEEAMRLARSQS